MLNHHFLSDMICRPRSYFFFFFNDTATTEIYTLSLHDALPICQTSSRRARRYSPIRLSCAMTQRYACVRVDPGHYQDQQVSGDRKSTRLNSSHSQISYAVFCLKKKKQLHTL